MWDHLYQTYAGKKLARKNQGIKRLALFRYQRPTIEGNLDALMEVITDTEGALGNNSTVKNCWQICIGFRCMVGRNYSLCWLVPIMPKHIGPWLQTASVSLCPVTG